MSKFRLVPYPQVLTTTLMMPKVSIVAYRRSGEMKKIYYVGKDDKDSIIFTPPPDQTEETFVIVVTASGDEEIKIGKESTFQLLADLDGSEIKGELKKKEESYYIQVTLLGRDPGTGEFGGYLWNNRRYHDPWTLGPFVFVPANPNIYYVLGRAEPVETEAESKILKPDYLQFCPAIYSDSNALKHKPTTGNLGGSNDWYCMIQTWETWKIYFRVYITKET